MNWAVIALAGGAAGLDANSFPQVMISRPVIAGTLTGWALGDARTGLMLGALHEVFNLSVLPVGASRYPEAGTATVAAVSALLLAAVPGWAAILVALAWALVWERIAGRTVVDFRRGIERLMLTHGQPLPTGRLERRHALAMGLDFLRGAAVALAGAALGAVAITGIAPRVDLPADAIRTGIAIAAGAALGGTLGVFGGWSERKTTLLLGVLAGCLIVILR